MSKIPKIYVGIDPHDLLCPILQETMTDPVLAPDGHTYQRESITDWFRRGHRRSPLTGQTLLHTIIVDNLFAKIILKEAQIAAPELEILKQAGIRADLEKCIEEKENFIQNIIDKVDRIIIEKNSSFDIATASLKKQIEQLKKLNAQMESKYLSQLELSEDKNKKLLKELNRLKLELVDSPINPDFDNLLQIKPIESNVDFSISPLIKTLEERSSNVVEENSRNYNNNVIISKFRKAESLSQMQPPCYVCEEEIDIKISNFIEKALCANCFFKELKSNLSIRIFRKIEASVEMLLRFGERKNILRLMTIFSNFTITLH